MMETYRQDVETKLAEAKAIIDAPPPHGCVEPDTHSAAHQQWLAGLQSDVAALLTDSQNMPAVCEPPPPPGQPNVFGRNTYELEYSMIVEGLTQLSGLCAGPAGTLWCVTDKNESGGRLHELSTDGVLLRSINFSGATVDLEDVAYMGDTLPGIGLWAVCSEDGDQGIHVFEMSHGIADQSVIDLSLFWFHPTLKAKEMMAWDSNTDTLHLCSQSGYAVVTFDRDAHTFSEADGSFDPTAFSGSIRTPIRGGGMQSPSMFRLRCNTSDAEIQEIDFITPDVTPVDDRLISLFDLNAAIEADPLKIEGGPVWNMTGDPEDCFYVVGESGWYQSQHPPTFLRFRKTA